jgi:hypothetical protein
MSPVSLVFASGHSLIIGGRASAPNEAFVSYLFSRNKRRTTISLRNSKRPLLLTGEEVQMAQKSAGGSPGGIAKKGGDAGAQGGRGGGGKGGSGGGTGGGKGGKGKSGSK